MVQLQEQDVGKRPQKTEFRVCPIKAHQHIPNQNNTCACPYILIDISLPSSVSAALVNWLSDSIVFLIEAAESITELSHEHFHTIGCRSGVAEKGNYTWCMYKIRTRKAALAANRERRHRRNYCNYLVKVCC
jgi:hypothetical protein